ncbi:hypothetical protein OG625_26830 [Streptomyces sp. NBC_01351]|uniref:hypothetical protein n=1 Tax=Streptomyces sp. NBC_01351 TaxID=2903833 RepID=UPI002E331BC1|nr:hypothetical protein [Streptomyces sp. NBC_01351]
MHATPPPAKPPASPTQPHSSRHGTGTGTRRRAAALAAAALAVAAVTPATLAHAFPSATVSPSTVAPGGRVALNVAGCGTKTGRASSTAFGDVRLTPGNLEATNLFGSATVFRNASTGTHRVLFECGGPGGERVTVALQVISGAARGGTGGSIGSMSPGQIVAGGALAAGALGTGVWLLRRRSTA